MINYYVVSEKRKLPWELFFFSRLAVLFEVLENWVKWYIRKLGHLINYFLYVHLYAGGLHMIPYNFNLMKRN